MNDGTEPSRVVDTPDCQRAEDLLPIVYEQLRRLARFQLTQEAAAQSLQTTDLVHEAYLRLVGGNQTWQGMSHFFGAAAEAMRRILVERARKKGRIRHGGNYRRVELQDTVAFTGPSSEEVILVNDLLDRFEKEHPLEAKIVKLHYFAGLNISEIGRALDIPSSSVHRQWAFARAWLQEALRADESDGSVPRGDN